MSTDNNKLIDLWMAQFEEYESDRLRIISDLNKGCSPRHYQNDWELLMEVVARIDNLPTITSSEEQPYYYCVKLEGAMASVLDSKEGDIVVDIKTDYTDWKANTYELAVEFIKWHNKNTRDSIKSVAQFLNTTSLNRGENYPSAETLQSQMKELNVNEDLQVDIMSYFGYDANS